jgi:hypothetical protein
MGGPEEFHMFLRPRAAEDVGGIEAGISGRDVVLCLRHRLWPPFEASWFLSRSIHPLVALARVTGVMSLEEVSARACPRG